MRKTPISMTRHMSQHTHLDSLQFETSDANCESFQISTCSGDGTAKIELIDVTEVVVQPLE